jgi:hemerythrin-like domain-containing protein
MPKRSNKQTVIRDLNIIDILLIDHRYVKECIEILTDETSTKKHKLKIAKDFLISLQKHSEAEKKIVYAPLKEDEEFHFNILEAEIEHGIADEKIKVLRPKIARAKILRDDLEAEMKVLAELVKHHVKEEESELLPRMSEYLEEETLKKMGQEFMRLRGMSLADLDDYPHLQDELVLWKDDVQKISSQFLSKMDKYVENLKH